MGTDRAQAKGLLASGDYTCVLCRDGEIRVSRERGVKPLLDWLNSAEDLRGFWAADKVVGKAAAFLYVLLGVCGVHAPVMSLPARQVLEQHNIPCSYDVLTDRIRNRTNTGYCPMETAVADIIDPKEAMAAIDQKLRELNR